MDITTMFPTIGSIAVICFALGELVKVTPCPTKYIPVIVAIFGGILGAAGCGCGISELANLNIFDAIATGICSGVVSSGAFSLISNLKNPADNNYSKKEQKDIKEGI